jgi:hypothetical protein
MGPHSVLQDVYNLGGGLELIWTRNVGLLWVWYKSVETTQSAAV